jgi:integrase
MSASVHKNPDSTGLFLLSASIHVRQSRLAPTSETWAGTWAGGVARGLHRLSVVNIASRKKPGYYADGGGLYLRVAPGGSKGWIFRFTRAARTRDAGLGTYPTISLGKAREQAEQCRRLLSAGIDPIEARREERDAARSEAAKLHTFEQCATAFIESHEVGWRNDKHRAQWRSTLAAHAYPIIGRLPVQEVDTELVLKVLKPVWAEKPETASRLRQRIERVLSWAKVRGYRDGENPAQWRGHLDHLLPAKTKVRRVEHHAALPYREIPAFMALLREQTSITACALEFLILTATRTGETLGARWDEIAIGERRWTIPAGRMKAGKDHRVPLSACAVAILKEMAETRQSEFVFPGSNQGRPLSQMSLAMLLRRMGYGHVTVHGFRSSFRDWAAECTSFQREVAEMALAHAVSDAVEAAYRRGDLLAKRRKLMEAWANFCASDAHASRIVPLLRRKV